MVTSVLCFEDVIKSVHQLQEKLEACYTEQFEIISSEVKKVLILPPQSKEECLQYSCQLTLDPNTANKCLQLSDSDRMVMDRDVQEELDLSYDYSYNYSYARGYSHNQQECMPQRYEHSDSFSSYSQVLCKESVCGPCYWEVEWNGSNGASVAVSYKDISRKGTSNECEFGRNPKSWTLQCNSSGYSFLHNNKETKIPMTPSSSRIGVFVDHKAGTLSFYSVSDTMKLLHRVQTTFTQPLYPGFGLNRYSSVKLCDAK